MADLFAGSGALGLEALSRGATSCVFVERDGAARQALADNVGTLGLRDRADILAEDATRLTKPRLPSAIGLAFLDPPYAEGLAEPALAALLDADWLADEALAVAEVGVRDTIRPSGYTLLDERVWGAAKVLFLQRA